MTADTPTHESDASVSGSAHLPRAGVAGPGQGGAASPLMSVQQLAQRLGSEPLPVLLDVRWALGGSDRGAFTGGHIPGALFLDLDTALAAPAGLGGRHPLPSPAFVHGWMRAAGIDADTPVVVTGQRDTSMAARAWWLLRWVGHGDVRVLDGGFEAWRRAGLPVATGFDASSDEVAVIPPAASAATRAEEIGGHLPTVGADAVAAVPGSDTALLDARAPERYRGETEPVDPVAGHIPGARNVPLSAIHDGDGLLLPPPILRAVFADAGVQAGRPAIASCGSGVTACSLILAAEVAGLSLALYPGSYSGWCALARPVVAGG